MGRGGGYTRMPGTIITQAASTWNNTTFKGSSRRQVKGSDKSGLFMPCNNQISISYQWPNCPGGFLVHMCFGSATPPGNAVIWQRGLQAICISLMGMLFSFSALYYNHMHHFTSSYHLKDSWIDLGVAHINLLCPLLFFYNLYFLRKNNKRYQTFGIKWRCVWFSKGLCMLYCAEVRVSLSWLNARDVTAIFKSQITRSFRITRYWFCSNDYVPKLLISFSPRAIHYQYSQHTRNNEIFVCVTN